MICKDQRNFSLSTEEAREIYQLIDDQLTASRETYRYWDEKTTVISKEIINVVLKHIEQLVYLQERLFYFITEQDK